MRPSTAIAESFGTSPQCPPTARLTNPSRREAIQPAILAVSGCGSEYQRQIARRRRLHKTLLQRCDELVGRTAADKAREGDGVAVANDGDGLGGRNDLVLHWPRPPAAVCLLGYACVVVGQEEVLDQLDLLVGHQRGRMPTVRNLDGFHATTLGGKSTPFHLNDRFRKQQVGVLAMQDKHRTLDTLPDAPQRDIEKHRSRELGDDPWVVVQPQLAVFLDDAVLGEMPPLRVAQGAERRVDLAQINLDFCERAKAGVFRKYLAMRRRAAAGTRAPKSLSTRRRMGFPGRAASSIPI